MADTVQRETLVKSNSVGVQVRCKNCKEPVLYELIDRHYLLCKWNCNDCQMFGYFNLRRVDDKASNLRRRMSLPVLHRVLKIQGEINKK